MFDMSEQRLTLVFDGEAVHDGEIDVASLAPALLNVGALIQAANQEINGKRAQIAVKVRATSVGSFEVDLNLTQSLMEATKSLFDFAMAHKDGIAASNELVDLLFKVVGGAAATGGGLIALVKFLKGRKPDKTEEKGGNIVITVGSDSFTTNARTLQLAQSVAVREEAKKTVSILMKDGIDTIKIRRTDHADTEITKHDVPYFEYQHYDAEDVQLYDEVRDMTLQIISLSFKEDNKWKVTDGLEAFHVTMEDAVFLNRIALNDVAFSKGDYLLCKVRTQQFITAKGLKKECAILEVLEHTVAARQLQLF